jgi:transcriptional regulator with XRE-family HTH domain
MDGRKLVGLNVRRLRVTKGISQERLAFDSGVDRSYLGGMERGEENPTVDVLERLAKILTVPLYEFFTAVDPAVSELGLKPGRKPRQQSDF